MNELLSLSFSLSEKLCYVPVEEGAMIEGTMDNSTFERYQRTRKVCKEGYVFEGDERIQNKGFQTIECEDSGGTMRWKYWERSNCTRKIFSYIMSFIFFYFNLYLYLLLKTNFLFYNTIFHHYYRKYFRVISIKYWYLIMFKASTFICLKSKLKLIESIVLWVYYTIPFGFGLFSHL